MALEEPVVPSRKPGTKHDEPMSKIRHWIMESGGCAGTANRRKLRQDTNLLQEGYVDSLGLMGLILFVEELRGAPISEKDMSAQNFSSLRQIERAFFTAPTDETDIRTADQSRQMGRIQHA